MHQYLIERNMPGVGHLTVPQQRAAAQKSNAVLSELAPAVQWVHSYVTADRLYCVYRAESEELVREHARRGGFPADKVSLVQGMLDPLSANP